MKAMTAIFMALVIALVLGSFGPAIDQHTEATETAREAKKAAQQETRLEKAARAICGDNAGFRLTNVPNEFQCVTKRGFVRATKGML